MSQTASGSARSTRSTIKRALSVDDLDAVLQSAPAGKFATNKTSEKALIFKRRRKLLTSQSQQAQNSHPQDIEDGNDSNTELIVDESVGNENIVKPVKTLAEFIEEIDTLKATVKTLQSQLNFVISSLGITDSGILLQNQAPQSKPKVGLSDIIPAAITTAQTSVR